MDNEFSLKYTVVINKIGSFWNQYGNIKRFFKWCVFNRDNFTDIDDVVAKLKHILGLYHAHNRKSLLDHTHSYNKLRILILKIEVWVYQQRYT